MEWRHALNPQQQKAVEHGEGPLLVIAGPGTGKTNVITQRIVHLLQHIPELKPENILALTFTEKAATEMKARVKAALGNPETAPPISTFHSFCYQVLRKRHFERRLLDKIDLWIFLRQRLDQLQLEHYQKLPEPGAFLHDLNEFFARCQDELVEPEDFEAYVAEVEREFATRAAKLESSERQFEESEILKLQELARVFRHSQRLVAEAGCSSLGSLIPETVRLFDREPEVAREYRERFRYVLVDEFQDTNFAQVELLKRLVAPPWNITAVGDDDQAIYRFRGAAYGAFEMFGRVFPQHEKEYLNRNYRSTQRILRCADAVITKNPGRYPGKPPLQATKEEGPYVYLLTSPDYVSEAVWIADQIQDLHRKETAWGDIAVLYRAHTHRDLLVDELRRRRIPFLVRGLSLLSTVIIRDLVAYLRLINSPHDNLSLTRVLLIPRWGFPEELALALRRQAARDRCSLFEVLQTWERTPQQSTLEQTGWYSLKRLLVDMQREAGRTVLHTLFARLRERLGLASPANLRDGAYLDALGKFLEDWEEKSATRKLREFMEYFDYFLEAGGVIEGPEPADQANAVQLMTVHAAKGLEFPVVFVLSVAPRRFPTGERQPLILFPDRLRKAPAPPAGIHITEERRLFFVAMTRAEERLYISSVVKPGKKPSPFVDDLQCAAVLRARDVESVTVPEVNKQPDPLAPPIFTTSGQQSNLFGTEPELRSVYPDLISWLTAGSGDSGEEKLRLSATAIEEYQDCPLKFKFSHVLCVPTGPQAALTFGNVMHQCVRRYFELRRDGPVPAAELDAFFNQVWKSVGFEDEYHEEAYRKAGRAQLRRFVEQQNQTEPKAEEILLERSFSFNLGQVKLEGRIDQVNRLHGSAAELIDYKTGRPRTTKETDRSLQLSIYALAAREEMGLDPVRLTFYNLSNNEAVSTVRTEKELGQVRKEIQEVASAIRQKRFAPTPGFVCKWCDFQTLCPVHEKH